MKIKNFSAAMLSLALLAGCGSDEQPPTVESKPVSQDRAVGYTPGTPRSKIRRELGAPLPVEDYALNAKERRECDYYALAGDPVSYDNVFRFCFTKGRLTAVATAPSREAAGPGAGAPSPDDPAALKPSGERGKRLPGS
jgi:hypothetical protein